MIPDVYNAEDSDGLGDFAFDFESQDMVSASMPDDAIEDKLLNMSPSDQFASDTGLFSQMRAPLPLRPHRSFTKYNDRASPTISGNELRNLEGKPLAGAQMTSLGMPVLSATTSSSAGPTLRRKGRFGPNTQNAPRYTGTHRVPKVPSEDAIDNGFQSPETPMSPSSCDWTQKFQQQISLHTSRPELANSQMQSLHDGSRESSKQNSGTLSPREHFQHRKAYSEQSALGSSYSHMVDYSQQISHSIPRDVNLPVSILSMQSSQNYDSSPQPPQQSNTSDSAFRHHRQAQSWGQAPANFANDYTVSPSQIHPNWVHGLPDESSSYFPNMAYPTPTSQEPAVMFSQEGLTTNCYAPELPLSHQSSFPNLPTDDILLNNLTNRRPHTPPPSNPSASPPTPEATPSPQKQTRASRRQGNINAPRLRKSTAALKPAKSLSALKCSKSAGHLRGKRSIGAGLNHQGSKSPIKKESQQGASTGFLNYTQDDKQKILGGVAPSGSSKTKARREFEASEERRKLKLAAIKAIEVAGGDSQALKQELKVEVDVDSKPIIA